MNLLDSIAGELVAAAVVTIVLQVTFVLAVTCGVACLMRRNAAARHAVCLAGLVLAVACPLMATRGEIFGWTWLRVDWVVDDAESSEPEVEQPVIDAPDRNAESPVHDELWAPADDALLAGDPEPIATESITVPPDVLYEPGRIDGNGPEDSTAVARTESTSAVVPPEPTFESPAVAVSDAPINRDAWLREGIRWGLAVWFVGVLVQAARWVAGRRRLQGLLRDVVELDPSRFGSAAADAAHATKLKRPVEILSGPLVPIPLVYGLFRPRVLLPRQFVERVEPGVLCDVLIHEYAHIARRDPWVSLFQRIAAVVYWPHPLVYLLNRQLTFAREELCDNHVLQTGRPSRFAEMLVSLSEQYQPARVPVGLLSLFARRNRLEARVAGLLSERRRTATRLRRGGVALLAVAGLGLLCATVGIRAGSGAATETPETEVFTADADDADGAIVDTAFPDDSPGDARTTNLSELTPESRQEILREIEQSSNEDERESRLRQALFSAEELLMEGDDPAVQLNAAILLASLNARPAIESGDGQQAAVPYVPAHRVLLTVLEDESCPAPVRMWAAQGLGRICRDADPDVTNGALGDSQRQAIAEALLAALDSVTPADADELADHFRFRLIEALGESGVVGAIGRRVASVLIGAVQDGQTSLSTRSSAARALGQLPVVHSDEIAERLAAIAHLALDLAREADKPEPSSHLRTAAFNAHFAFKPMSDAEAAKGWGLLTQASRFRGRDSDDVIRLYLLVTPITTAITRELNVADVNVAPAAVTTIETWLAKQNEERADPENGLPGIRPNEAIAALAEHCSPWINTPGEELRSLQYTYTLGNDERRVELVRGVSDVRRGTWQGATLSTGLHWLLRGAVPSEVGFTYLYSQNNDAPKLLLILTPEADQQPLHLEIGNGISGSWRGYFSHPSDKMSLAIDAERMLPLWESHTLGSQTQITTIFYHDWEQIDDDRWIPKRIEVRHDEAIYHMHFAWKEGVAWLLTHAETEYEGNTQEVARVSDVVVNDEELIQRSREEQGRQEAAAGVVRTVLEHNRPWLANDLSGLDSLSYTFHTLREDVKEQCVVTDDGTVAMQVTHDGQGKMGDRLGERQTALPSGEWARAQRDDRFALIHDPSEQDRGQPYAEQIQHYGRIGCQFDLPLFRYDEFLDGATVEIEDGEWNGTPCHVATVRALGRDVYFGCGTMLGFTSWSYVHHIRPAYETIYIDRERNVPLHETLVSSWENKRFEIDFSDYREVEPGQWAPLSIRVESPDYFTCEMTYQLVEGRHWVLSEVESWFDPDNRSRGVVEDVAVNQPSELRDAVLEQIEATRAVFGDAGEAVSQTVEVPTHPFVLGRQVRVGSLEVLFTLNPAGELIVQCAPAEGQTIEAGRSVSVLLLDEADRILNAAQEPFMKRGGRFEAVAGFGRSTGLANVSRYVICSDDGYIDDLSSTVRQLRVRPSAGPADLTTLAPVADESGKTSVIEVAVRPEDDGQAVAAVHFASQDRLNEFGLDVSVGVFNREGRLIAAGAKPGTLLVKSNIVEETWEVPLPHLESGADFDRVAVGLSRGQTYSAPTGTLWGRFMTNYPIFDVETMLAAEDTGCWQVGLEELEERVRDEVLQRGLLDSVRDWKEQVAEQRTHHDLLRPRVERLLHILGRTEEPQLLAAAIRLLGLSGDQGAATSVRSHLDSADPGVRDVAAIALGMLGEADVLPAIESVLSRDVPSFADDPEGYRRHRARGNDALIALVMLRTDESVSLVRELLLESLGRIEYVPLDNGGYSWRGTHLPDALAKLMGCITDPRYVAVLTDALATIEDQRPGDGRFSTDEFVTALHEYGDAARAAIVSRVRNGDLSVLPSRDPYYVPMVRDAMLAGGTPAETLYPGVRYLWNAGTDEAIEALRSVYETRPPQDPRTRLYLCEALAYHGDDRGLPEAFELLVAACAPEEPPEDADARRQWERERENARDDPLDVFERAKTVSRIAVVEQHLEAEDVATQIACVEVLGTLRGAMPEPVRETLESWSGSDNLEVSTGATLLLQRQ